MKLDRYIQRNFCVKLSNFKIHFDGNSSSIFILTSRIHTFLYSFIELFKLNFTTAKVLKRYNLEKHENSHSKPIIFIAECRRIVWILNVAKQIEEKSNECRSILYLLKCRKQFNTKLAPIFVLK